VLTGFLFERTLRLIEPGAWRNLKQYVNEHAVKNAVRAYLARLRRISEADNPELGDVLGHDSEEESADEAVSKILDDALRAIDERRSTDFNRAMESVKSLIEYAMTEIEAEGVGWGAPGASPSWPPLYELHRRLYVFREGVIGRGGREHAAQLRSLDSWFLSRAVRHRCGELLTVGLDGFLWNYEIAVRSNRSEMTEFFVDTTWTSIRGGLLDLAYVIPEQERPNRLFPFVLRLPHQLERMMSAAMNANRPDDFSKFAEGMQALLRHLSVSWSAHDYPRPASADMYSRIEQLQRIALMGLGGRAIILKEAGRLGDLEPYISVIRRTYPDVRVLADDVSFAVGGDREEQFMWSDWEMEPAGDLEARWVNSRQYPLSFFTVRLIELATPLMPALNLHGQAKTVLEWFEANAERLEQYALKQDDNG
jgi:hypothetical protein